MMGQHDGQAELFSYQVNLERRVWADHPLRAIRAAINFTFEREEVVHCYGRNGNDSVDPAVILKLMFALFFDNVTSERELMRTLPERLDYLWFLGSTTGSGCGVWGFDRTPESLRRPPSARH